MARRGSNEEVNQLHAERLDHAYVGDERTDLLSRHTLRWVTAHDDHRLVGIVHVIWDPPNSRFSAVVQLPVVFR